MAEPLLEALLDGSCALRGDLAGVAGLMRTTARWDTGPTQLAEHLCYYVLRGDAVAEASGRSWALAAHSLLVVPPHRVFRVRCGQRPPHILRCRFVVARGRLALSVSPGPLVVESAQALRPFLEGLVAEVHAPRAPPAHAARVRAFLVLLVTGLSRPSAALAAAGRLSAGQQQRLHALIEQDEELRLTPRDLARHLGLSLDYFTRCFRRSWGEAPRTYLVRSRILAACRRLVQNTASIQETARASGWDDVNLFTRQFRMITGTTPGRWRAQHGSNGPV